MAFKICWVGISLPLDGFAAGLRPTTRTLVLGLPNTNKSTIIVPRKEVLKMVKYKRKGQPSKAPPKAIFDMQYYDMNLSAKEMAEMYNVKIHTVYNWATMYRNQDKAEK